MSEQGPAIHDLGINRITLRVETWGRRAEPECTVLLVHGITANSQYWSEVGPSLAAEGWWAIAPDLRGRGRSAKPPHGYGPAIHAVDLLGICDALALPVVNLVGHSLGALIGLYLAAVHPHRLAKLVLIDAGGKLPPDTVEAIAPALARLGVSYPSLDAYLDAMLGAPHLTPDTFWDRYYRYDAETRPNGTVMSSVPKTAVTEDQAALFLTRTDVLPEYVKAPTLIVRATEGLLGGERGQILPAAEAERLRTVIPHARVVELPETNHYTVVRAESFVPTLAEFLSEEA